MAENTKQVDQEFIIKRIYVKDFSFEAPGGAQTFTNPWKPDITIDVDATDETLGENVYEVVLTLTVTVSNAGSAAFMIEVLQCGIFSCVGFTDEQCHRILHTACPNTLFPYAREAIDNMVLKGSFPALMIGPVNFEELYNEHSGKDGDLPA